MVLAQLFTSPSHWQHLTSAPTARSALADIASAALLVACKSDRRPKILRVALANGADWGAKDSDGYSCAHHAATHGNVESLKTLCDGSVASDLANASDADGRRPLHVAAMHGHTAACEVLKRANADQNAVDDTDRRTALHLAAAGGFVDTVRTLIPATAAT